jgi:hypothetical protein
MESRMIFSLLHYPEPTIEQAIRVKQT